MSDVTADAVSLLQAQKHTVHDLLTAYYRLTKPGIIYSNTLMAVSGYLFAARWHVHASVLLSLVGGTALLIASACVLNNYIDRPLDRRMQRTQKRALVTGAVSGRNALFFALVLGLLGYSALRGTNVLTMIIGMSAVFSYVVLYGIAKRQSAHGTLVGTLPGAASLVAGYTAVSGRLDVTALLLCLIMVAWQMPHFYAIAVRRLEDYTNAGLPVWPVKYGVRSTAYQIAAYISLFMASGLLLTLQGSTGITFAIGMLTAGVLWLRVATRGLRTRDNNWARATFLFSLIVLLSFSLLLPLGTVLP